MGKHDIIFNMPKSVDRLPQLETLTDQDVASLNQEIDSNIQLPAANLQIMNGHNIGKILHLKKALTRLGHHGSGVIVISKRKEGYFVSALENTGTIFINDAPLNDTSHKLNTNDVLVIDNTSLQFFLN